ncbi:hypothetical protein ACFQ2B_02015 [Streptomyces stramineus]
MFVETEHVLRTPPNAAEKLDELNEAGVIWFQMIIAASYAGVAGALVDLVLRERRGSAADRARLCLLIDTAAFLVEGIARRIMDGDLGNDCAAASLFTRFSVQDVITRAVAQAVEMLGGMAYIASPKIAYLAAAAQAVVFHPVPAEHERGGRRLLRGQAALLLLIPASPGRVTSSSRR